MSPIRNNMSSREQRVIAFESYQVLMEWVPGELVPTTLVRHISRPGATSGTTAGGQPVADPTHAGTPRTPKSQKVPDARREIRTRKIPVPR